MKEESQFTNDTAKYAGGTYAASPTDPLYVAEIPLLKFQSGKEPLETLEAQYWNWIWKIATKNINAFVDYLDDLYSELNNLLTEFGVTPSGLTATQLADMFKSEYAVTFLGTKYLSLNGGTVDGDVHVKGDLTVDGIGEEIISTELKVGADTITLRNGNPTAMSATELAGVITENYDGNGNNNILAVDKDGNARVGDIDIATRLLYSNDGTNFFEDEALTITATIGQDEIVRDTGNTTSGGVKIYEGTTFSNDDTEAIATREDSPVNGGYAKWNAGAKRFDAAVPDAAPTAGSQNLATSGGIFAAVAAASNNFILTAQGATDAQKTIDLPGGQISEGQTVTVNFKNGHAMSYNNPMTLNNILVVSNQNGTLAPIPLHAMTEGGQTVYKALDPNTILSVYYTADYDGNGTPAFVIVENPLVLSSATYLIYANGWKTDASIDLIDITSDFVLSTSYFSLDYVRYNPQAKTLYVRFHQNVDTPISAYNNVVISNRGGHVSIPQYAFSIASLNTLDAKLDVFVSANVLTSDNISVYTYNYSNTSPQTGGTQYSVMIQLT